LPTCLEYKLQFAVSIKLKPGLQTQSATPYQLDLTTPGICPSSAN
jgi:hypothetical protein